MIELKDDALVVSFPDLHRRAVLRIEFQRTLRIPDDGRTYPLPPGLGRFPLRHVDDFTDVPDRWRTHGGVMLPMYQSEALWINFRSPHGYPFAVKVAAGKINAVTGDPWDNELHKSPQDYLAVPRQPWLDGFCVRKGVIRQFVAMPLGAGYTAEEQLTGTAEHGGIQIVAYPIAPAVYDRQRKQRIVRDVDTLVMASLSAPAAGEALDSDMGLAPGGEMRQEIADDTQRFADWRQDERARCFVHLANSLVWRAITGAPPPSTPLTAKEYTKAGYPWFDYYDDQLTALEGSEQLARLKSILQMGRDRGNRPLPENESVDADRVIRLGPRRGSEVREGVF